jgi:hypothetical protein
VMRASGSRSDGAGFSTIGRSEGAVAVMGEVQLIMGLKEEEEEEGEKEGPCEKSWALGRKGCLSGAVPGRG